jgi:hypothetical protein
MYIIIEGKLFLNEDHFTPLHDDVEYFVLPAEDPNPEVDEYGFYVNERYIGLKFHRADGGLWQYVGNRDISQVIELLGLPEQ